MNTSALSGSLVGTRPFRLVSKPCHIHRQNSRIALPAPISASNDDTASISDHNNALEQSSRRDALQAILAGIAFVGAQPAAQAAEDDERRGEIYHTDEEWKELLTPTQYAVLRTAATERRNSSPLLNEHRTGTFACAGCGSDLFPSSAKFDSGTGWPSFYDALPGAVDETIDNSILFMTRTEVRCKKCQGHLGHVFPDGPAPTGLRYCMNGAAMTFKPA